MNKQRNKKSVLIKLGVTGAICCLLVIMFLLLPKGFKDDLSLIGKGSVAVVLTHDKNLVNSVQMMELMNEVRSDYEGAVEFLAVDIATPVGQGFVRDQQLGSLSLVLFGRDGQRLQILDSRVNEQQLRTILDEILVNSGT